MEEYFMDDNWLALLQQQNQIKEIMETNQTTAKYGIALSEQDAKLVVMFHL